MPEIAALVTLARNDGSIMLVLARNFSSEAIPHGSLVLARKLVPDAIPLGSLVIARKLVSEAIPRMRKQKLL